MFERVLVLSPHTDDGEFGCGGTIARMLDEGKQVYHVAFSAAEKSVPAGYPEDVLRQEIIEASAVLGVPKSNLTVLAFPVRDFPAHRQEILDEMIQLRDQIQPDLVLLPSLNDTHQDHYTVAIEGLRAFKRSSSMLGYEVPWNNLTFNTTCFSQLQPPHLERKVKALLCYKSQSSRDYAKPDFISSLARTRGTQIGATYAEVFDVIRLVLR